VNFFAQILAAGKHFPEKLLTFSHNSQNRHPFDTQLALPGTKAHFPRRKPESETAAFAAISLTPCFSGFPCGETA
jgi:hypothetical protein